MGDEIPLALRKEFLSLSGEWKARTRNMSVGAERDPAYLRIIKLGKPVLPLLFEDMAATMSSWEHAICEITGEHPTLPKWARGRVAIVIHYFMGWGREKGWYEPLVARNAYLPALDVLHSSLYRADLESTFRSICPKCFEGLLLMRRGDDFKLLAEDMCVMCAQRFVYDDIDDLNKSGPDLRLYPQEWFP